MPTVPTSFVPQVAPQGGGDIGQFQAPQVAVAENLAAAQQVRFGGAMTAAGNQVFRLGSAIQDGIDEAQAKAADIAFLQQANEILRGQQGYLRISGKDAESQYASTRDALSQAGQSALDSLQNDTQKAMFKTPLARNMMSFQSQALDHRDREVKVFYANESNVRAEQYIALAIDDYKNRASSVGNYEVYRGVAINELQQSALAQGIPRESAQFKALTQKVETQLAAGVVNRLMLDNEYQEAYDWVNAQRKAGNLELKAGEALIEAVDANRDRYLIFEYAKNIRRYGRVGLTTEWQLNDETNRPEDLRAALGIAEDRIKDPGIRKGVEAQLRTDFAQEDALARQEYNTNVDRIEQFLAIPGNTVEKVPPSLWARLRPTDQTRFLAADLQQDELGVMEELARDPAVLTRDYLEKNRGRMTRQTYIKLLGDLSAPDKIIAATLDADQVEATFLANGMTQLANPKTDAEKNESLTLRNLYKQQIDDMQNGLKRQLTRTEKQKVMDQVILQYNEKVYEPDWIFDNELRAGTLTPEQMQTVYVKVGAAKVNLASIPQEWVSGVALPEFRKAGVTNPTMKQIAEYWLRKGKPSQ
jgi:hypothetical protein